MEWGWIIVGIIFIAVGVIMKKVAPPIRSGSRNRVNDDPAGLKKYLPK